MFKSWIFFILHLIYKKAVTYKIRIDPLFLAEYDCLLRNSKIYEKI